MSKYLGVSTSGFYDFLNRKESKQSKRKKNIKQLITEIYNESNQIYGAPKITKILRQRGYTIAEKTVGNYMKELNIRAIWVTPYKRVKIYANFDSNLKNILDRKFNPASPNTVWVTDITYIYTLSGFVYLASIMDLYSRKIDSPIIIHSDRGVQYISKAYIEATPAENFIRSYSRKGNPWDNAVIESFHALIKREWLNRFVIQHLSHAHELIFEYVETFYNTKRIHSHWNMKSPYDYEEENVI